jgi:hypothetical protein
MTHIKRLVLTAVIGLLAAVAMADADDTASTGPDFETLKSLAGEWHAVDSSGKISGTTRYEVTSAGTAVVETMLAGTTEEMMTVYTRDGNALAVTHYCAGGNQPHLVSAPGPAPNQLQFDFKGAGNLKSVEEAHMHSLTLTFIDQNHVKQEWVTYANGKVAETMVFSLTRKT